MAWVAGRTNIPSLRHIAALLGLAFGYLLLPQILLLVQLGAFSVLGAELQLQDAVPVAMYPAFQLGLPAVFFLLAAYLFRRDNDNLLVHGLELAALASCALMGHYLTAQLFHPGENVLFITRTFLEQGIMTNVMFGFGVLLSGDCPALRTARLRDGGRAGCRRSRCSASAISICSSATPYGTTPRWRACPWLTRWPSPSCCRCCGYGWPRRNSPRPATSASSAGRGYAPRLMLLLVFVWVNFEIRRLYQGSFLDGYTTGDGEFYTYSVVWLLFGLAMLFAGTLRGNQFLRYASLALMLLTVTKVFLFDAGSLTGLYRVFSFLGLGL